MNEKTFRIIESTDSRFIGETFTVKPEDLSSGLQIELSDEFTMEVEDIMNAYENVIILSNSNYIIRVMEVGTYV